MDTSIKRKITEVLLLRSDISPFLVHLTKNSQKNFKDAKEIFEKILEEQKLIPGNSNSPPSIASFGLENFSRDSQSAKFSWNKTWGKAFRAVCFTETPLEEIHCLLDIQKRSVDLEPYGLVFWKDILERKGVQPAIYLNNYLGDKHLLIKALVEASETNKVIREEFLPLLTMFGRKVDPGCGSSQKNNGVNFYWEREWRYPSCRGNFEFDWDDVCLGLCPHGRIQAFEQAFSLTFIDPRRNLGYYPEKMIELKNKIYSKATSQDLNADNILPFTKRPKPQIAI